MWGMQAWRRVVVGCSPKSSLFRASSLRWSSNSAAGSPIFEVERSTGPIKEEVFLSGYETIQQLKEADSNVRKVFDLEFARRREHNKVKMAEIIDKYKLREGDNSSAEVQVAVLTLRVRLLTEHLQNNRKDKSCLRRLIQLVQRRRKLLLVLKEFRPNSYQHLLTELNLRPPAVTKYQYKKARSKKAKRKQSF